jgi:hypothetical protein
MKQCWIATLAPRLQVGGTRVLQKRCRFKGSTVSCFQDLSRQSSDWGRNTVSQIQTNLKKTYPLNLASKRDGEEGITSGGGGGRVGNYGGEAAPQQRQQAGGGHGQRSSGAWVCEFVSCLWGVKEEGRAGPHSLLGFLSHRPLRHLSLLCFFSFVISIWKTQHFIFYRVNILYLQILVVEWRRLSNRNDE